MPANVHDSEKSAADMTPFDNPPERRRLTRAGAGELVSALAVGTTSGIPLDEIFLALADDANDRRLRRVAARIAAELQQGADVSTALAAVRGALPPYVERALAASMDQGQTASVMAALARHESTRQRIRRQIWSALTYPLVVLVLLGMIVLGLTTMIVPQFDEIYADFDLELGELTNILLTIARIAPWVLAGAPLLVLLVATAGIIPQLARTVHWLRTGVPLVGQMWICSAQHEFASILGALVGQQVAIEEALICTAESLRDRNLARSTRIAAEKCADGALLSTSLAESIHFDAALPALVSWGESRGKLTEGLRQATLAFERELEMRAAFLQRIMPAVLFLTVVTTMFFFAVGLMIPLVDMIANLGMF
jgi:general secretion pathway protein F